MKKTILATMAAVAAFAAAPSASATTFPVGSPNFTGTPGPGGTFSANFGNSGIATGDFSDSFTFTLPANGLGSGTVTTSASIFGSPNDLDFTSVTINNMMATLTKLNGGLYEVAFAGGVPITGGVLNTLTVTGVSRGSGAYGGQLSFIPSATAVPEPAAWAMMILGMGAVGFAMRRSNKKFDAKIKRMTAAA
ncbi:FxDxF family PEP-CTERM protein [Sphingomonas sp. A2-49]|uniref:FxDxF family PEP-CTERM protein n=1 Tax=Sphingomonas sp. A2-49 TaxID=1391375 RepID=UPI0021CE1E3B|nr:FxDxF family PEP-CTERM protein [Sphingomonas sp. A2-49]MCU6456134.1 FxDxF family PEP-CTERM protein [Sphingomonas sp. A2-49]